MQNCAKKDLLKKKERILEKEPTIRWSWTHKKMQIKYDALKKKWPKFKDRP